MFVDPITWPHDRRPHDLCKLKNTYCISSKIVKGIYSDKILNSEWGKVNWNLVDSNEMKKLLIQDNHNSRPLKIFMPKTIKSIRKLRFLDILWSNLGILITSYQFVAYKGLYWGHIWLYMNFAVNKDQYDIKMKRNGIWIWCLSISIKSRLFFVVCLTLVIYLWYISYHINIPVTIFILCMMSYTVY